MVLALIAEYVLWRAIRVLNSQRHFPYMYNDPVRLSFHETQSLHKIGE